MDTHMCVQCNTSDDCNSDSEACFDHECIFVELEFEPDSNYVAQFFKALSADRNASDEDYDELFERLDLTQFSEYSQTRIYNGMKR